MLVALTAAAVHDALCGSIAMSTRAGSTTGIDTRPPRRHQPQVVRRGGMSPIPGVSHGHETWPASTLCRGRVRAVAPRTPHPSDPPGPAFTQVGGEPTPQGSPPTSLVIEHRDVNRVDHSSRRRPARAAVPSVAATAPPNRGVGERVSAVSAGACSTTPWPRPAGCGIARHLPPAATSPAERRSNDSARRHQSAARWRPSPTRSGRRCAGPPPRPPRPAVDQPARPARIPRAGPAEPGRRHDRARLPARHRSGCDTVRPGPGRAR